MVRSGVVHLSPTGFSKTSRKTATMAAPNGCHVIETVQWSGSPLKRTTLKNPMLLGDPSESFIFNTLATPSPFFQRACFTSDQTGWSSHVGQTFRLIYAGILSLLASRSLLTWFLLAQLQWGMGIYTHHPVTLTLGLKLLNQQSGTSKSSKNWKSI